MRLLGDRVDRGAALNAAHVVRGVRPLLCENVQRIDARDQLREAVDGVFVTKIHKGVAALGAHRHLIADRADAGVVGNREGKAVKADKLPDAIAKVLKNAAHAQKIAKPLLGGVKDKENTAARTDALGDEEFYRQKQSRHACGVVAYPGAVDAHTVVGVGHRRAVGEDRVGMGGKHGQGQLLLTVQQKNRIFRFVGICALRTDAMKIGAAKFRALILKERGRGDGTELLKERIQLLLVLLDEFCDPLAVGHGFFLLLFLS